MKKVFLICFIIVVIAAVAIAISMGDSNKIIVGVDNNPPYTFLNQPVSVDLDKNGVAVVPDSPVPARAGFDIDVIESAAKKAGLVVEYRDIGFAKMLRQIEQGKQSMKLFLKSYVAPRSDIDVAIGGISITPERKQSVDFTIPYAKGGACIVTSADSNIRTAADLAGKTVGVELATTMVKQANAIKGIKLKGYHDQQNMFIDIYSKDLDAIVMDKMSAEYCIKERKMKNLKIVNLLSNEEFAMAVRKGDKKLVEKLDAALTQMEKSGELKKIYDKWFTPLQK